MKDELIRCAEGIEKLAGYFEEWARRQGDTAGPAPDFSSFLAFRWEKHEGSGKLVPIAHPHLVNLDDLIGIDMQKEILVMNSAQFVAGYPANNVLLWGERGNGKSSCIKGILKKFSPKGLRMVEVQRWDLMSLPAIIAMLRNQPFRFIIFCDDLAFSESETGYRALKTFLEGGLEERPENILIYATSNRRHLLPERMSDNIGNEELHPEEAVSEKLALSERFGISVGFTAFNRDKFLAIVDHYAAQMGLELDREMIAKEALLWSIYNGGRTTGRAARQFIDDLAGKIRLAQKGLV